MITVMVNSERPLAGSNQVEGKGINFNKSTMEEDYGDDAAVKGSNYPAWDDEWSW